MQTIEYMEMFALFCLDLSAPAASSSFTRSSRPYSVAVIKAV